MRHGSVAHDARLSNGSIAWPARLVLALHDLTVVAANVGLRPKLTFGHVVPRGHALVNKRPNTLTSDGLAIGRLRARRRIRPWRRTGSRISGESEIRR